MGKGSAKLRSLQRKLHPDTKGWTMKQTSLRGIANKAASDKAHRFRNLFGMLTVGYLLWCWQFVNKRAASGVDRANSSEESVNERIRTAQYGHHLTTRRVQIFERVRLINRLLKPLILHKCSICLLSGLDRSMAKQMLNVGDGSTSTQQTSSKRLSQIV